MEKKGSRFPGKGHDDGRSKQVLPEVKGTWIVWESIDGSMRFLIIMRLSEVLEIRVTGKSRPSVEMGRATTGI